MRSLQYQKYRELKWDNTVRKNAPGSLRGLKCTTPEPWAEDGVRFGCAGDRLVGQEGSTTDVLADALLRETIKYNESLCMRRRLRAINVNTGAHLAPFVHSKLYAC